MALTARNNPTASEGPGKPCSIARCYEAVAHDPAELAELNVILYEEDNTQGQVFETLTREGDFNFRIGFQSVNRHRGKGCRCFREEPSKFCHECRRDIPSCICQNKAAA